MLDQRLGALAFVQPLAVGSNPTDTENEHA
jgi:hypothetical protein